MHIDFEGRKDHCLQLASVSLSFSLSLSHFSFVCIHNFFCCYSFILLLCIFIFVSFIESFRIRWHHNTQNDIRCACMLFMKFIFICVQIFLTDFILVVWNDLAFIIFRVDELIMCLCISLNILLIFFPLCFVYCVAHALIVVVSFALSLDLVHSLILYCWLWN